MKKIPLTQNKYALVDDEDYETLSKFKWCIHCGYAVRRMPKESSRLLYMHRMLINPPFGKQIDHINMDRLDNRRSNLRVVSKSENMRNRPKQVNNTSGFKGVSLDKRKPFKKWRANIQVDSKAQSLGYFLTKEEAYQAYKNAAFKLHGEFAHI